MTDTIVLGLDGATWNVLDPLIDAGELPNIAECVRSGYSGTLESTYPPITGPAWLSMATGQNPGKTGVFYFLNRTSTESFDFEPIGIEDFRGRSFWDVLSANGCSVGVFNFPMLYPPYEIDGFMVSGFGAPEDETLTAPASLHQELDDIADGYEVKVPYADPKYVNTPESLKHDLLRVLKKRGTAMEYLLSEKQPDVFFGVISVTDWAQHYFWRYFDEGHALHDDGHEEALVEIFSAVDEVVGHISAFAEENNANLLIVSDHGFGPVNGTFYSNEWLEGKGLRVPRFDSPLQRFRSTYFPYLRRLLEPVVSRVTLLNDLATNVGRSIRASPLDNIDREQSVAFSSEQGYTTGLIYMLSDESADRERVEKLLCDACDSQGLSVNIYSPEDLYHGSNVELAPDILFDVEDFEYAVDPRYSTAEKEFVKKPPTPSRSGGHRMEGIYAFSGPDIKAGEGERRSLLDISPTLLALHSLPIPEEMDGEPISGSFLTAAEVSSEPLVNLVETNRQDNRQNAKDVRDRLEDLGYL